MVDKLVLRVVLLSDDSEGTFSCDIPMFYSLGNKFKGLKKGPILQLSVFHTIKQRAAELQVSNK